MTMERIADYPVEPVFLNRWSPRAFDASTLPRQDLMSVLEAARWAPSAFNIQPWRFLYSLREDEHWQRYLSLLDDFNAGWAKNASALVFVLSDTLMPRREGQDPQALRSHSFDAGAAWAQLALQATSLGYQAHAMAGIHFDRIADNLDVPEQYRVEIAIAIGRRAEASALPAELAEREKPSPRLPVRDLAFEGVFPHD